MSDVYHSLTRDEVAAAIERKNPPRVPMIRCKWWGEGLREQYGSDLDELEKYPEDCGWLWLDPIDYKAMNLPWDWEASGAHDSRVVLDDWNKLDAFIERLPDPWTDSRFGDLVTLAEQYRAEDRYIMFGWWRLFFERPWAIRGMSSLMMDYYLEPDNVHRLHEALCKVYCGYIERAAAELHPDGFWTSDDLGHQTQLMMPPKVFRKFLKPYYQRVGEVVHNHNLHWWLHSCGNNTEILGDLIEVGLNVFHPVQKGTMDMVAVVAEYGDRLTFLAGLDVQHALQELDPEGVRAEVRWLVDTFDRPDGGMCIAAGNGIVAGTPLENIRAFLDEAFYYGARNGLRNERISK